jgi:hypothetical protein
MKPEKSKTLVTRVRWDRRERLWRVDGFDFLDPWRARKRDAVTDAVCEARRAWFIAGQPVELVIHAKDGRIHERRSYGCETRRPG